MQLLTFAKTIHQTINKDNCNYAETTLSQINFLRHIVISCNRITSFPPSFLLIISNFNTLHQPMCLMAQKLIFLINKVAQNFTFFLMPSRLIKKLIFNWLSSKQQPNCTRWIYNDVEMCCYHRTKKIFSFPSFVMSTWGGGCYKKCKNVRK